MMKMLISLDEGKILSEGIYDINKINQYLMDLFENNGMKKANDGWYCNGSFTACGSIIIKLSQADWFMDNVREWLWYDSDDESTEDLKAHYQKR